MRRSPPGVSAVACQPCRRNPRRPTLTPPHPTPPPAPRTSASSSSPDGARCRSRTSSDATPPRASRRASRSSTGSSATRTRCCPSSRTRCSPATTSSSWASGVRRRPASSARSSAARRVDARSSPARRSTTTRTRRCRTTPATWWPNTARTRRSSGCTATQRFGEKLATPDTSIADLIGEVDPIKVAEGRYLSDELTLHYGLVPRTNRGIFAINELPDLAERIQVGLLNVLEERDVQIRGYKIRLPARRDARGLGQPRGLHQPRPHHHAAQGPLRRADPHPLPARRRHRDGPSSPRRRSRSRRRLTVATPDFMAEIVAELSPAGPSEHAHQPAIGRVGAPDRSPTTRRSWPTRRAGRCAAGEAEVVPRGL